jgi:hypothetical protein
MSLSAIRRELRLDHSTARRFARAQGLDELLAKVVNRASILDIHKHPRIPPRASTARLPSSMYCFDSVSPCSTSSS